MNTPLQLIDGLFIKQEVSRKSTLASGSICSHFGITHFKMSKIPKKNRCTSGHYMLTHKILPKRHFLCRVKKTINFSREKSFGALKFVFFTQAIKNALSMRNFVYEHKMTGG